MRMNKSIPGRDPVQRDVAFLCHAYSNMLSGFWQNPDDGVAWNMHTAGHNGGVFVHARGRFAFVYFLFINETTIYETATKSTRDVSKISLWLECSRRGFFSAVSHCFLCSNPPNGDNNQTTTNAMAFSAHNHRFEQTTYTSVRNSRVMHSECANRTPYPIQHVCECNAMVATHWRIRWTRTHMLGADEMVFFSFSSVFVWSFLCSRLKWLGIQAIFVERRYLSSPKIACLKYIRRLAFNWSIQHTPISIERCFWATLFVNAFDNFVSRQRCRLSGFERNSAASIQINSWLRPIDGRLVRSEWNWALAWTAGAGQESSFSTIIGWWHRTAENIQSQKRHRNTCIHQRNCNEWLCQRHTTQPHRPAHMHTPATYTTSSTRPKNDRAEQQAHWHV